VASKRGQRDEMAERNMVTKGGKKCGKFKKPEPRRWNRHAGSQKNRRHKKGWAERKDPRAQEREGNFLKKATSNEETLTSGKTSAGKKDKKSLRPGKKSELQ